MVNSDINLKINPEIIEKLSLERAMPWAAAHDDGSDNRINVDAVADAATIDLNVGAITAGALGIRKLFKNRDKTKEDLAAEKEARQINGACQALEVLLAEYIKSAQQGMINERDLDFLIERLDEIHGYNKSGKMVVSDKQELAEIQKSITEYTAAIAKSRSVPFKQTTGEDEFMTIKEQLLMQKKMLGMATEET